MFYLCRPQTLWSSFHRPDVQVLPLPAPNSMKQFPSARCPSFTSAGPKLYEAVSIGQMSKFYLCRPQTLWSSFHRPDVPVLPLPAPNSMKQFPSARCPSFTSAGPKLYEAVSIGQMSQFLHVPNKRSLQISHERFDIAASKHRPYLLY